MKLVSFGCMTLTYYSPRHMVQLLHWGINRRLDSVASYSTSDMRDLRLLSACTRLDLGHFTATPTSSRAMQDISKSHANCLELLLNILEECHSQLCRHEMAVLVD
jgi:hypothetical protein